MPTRVRKVRKFRGGRTHGWGQSAGHRGSGSKGGYGKTGGHKHGWTWTVVHDPNHFGKDGFKRAWVDRPSAINAGVLDEVSDELVAKKLAIEETDGIHIDLNALGIRKLLGGGKIEKALIIKVDSFSEAAKRKIEEAKGRILPED
jgi:large subunit ribosomal protein L15